MKWTNTQQPSRGQYAISNRQSDSANLANSRRAFLKNSSKAAFGLAFLPSTLFLMKKPPSIAIVGAGLAGLATAYRLQQFGFEPTVFEANERVGGRVFTVRDFTSGGMPLEVGGEFILPGHRNILKLADELGVALEELDDELMDAPQIFYSGQRLSPDDLQWELRLFRQKILDDAASLPKTLSFRNADAYRHFDEISAKKYLQEIGMRGWSLDFLCKSLTARYGTDASLLSAVHLLQWFPKNRKSLGQIPTGTCRIKNGNDTLPNALAASLKNPVELGHELVRIKELFSGYELEFNAGKSGRKIFTVDYLVLAMPFSTLRKIERKAFFYRHKILAVNNLHFGDTGRMFLEFREKLFRNTRFNSDQPFANGTGNENIFSIVSSGKEGMKFPDVQPENIASNNLSALSKVYPGIRQKFTGRVMKFSWADSPFALGSNSCYRVGEFTKFGGVEAEPEENIFFAGEHCSMQFRGTMNGAVASGEEAAQQISNKLGGVVPAIFSTSELMNKTETVVQENQK